MDGAQDLRDFAGVCRLFPLPGVVQFPQSVLPLHIFEPRYRQMTEDALAEDHLITVVQLLPKRGTTEPMGRPFERIGCLGKIIRHDRLPDGRFNLLLRGLRRVELEEEIPSEKLYRLCRARIVEDLDDGMGLSLISELVRLFRRFLLKTSGQVEPEVAKLFGPDTPLGLLTDMLGHAMPFPAGVKQGLLNEFRVTTRAEMLAALLGIMTRPPVSGVDAEGGFPPPFSAN